MSREKTLSLWKYNKRSGMWDHQRGVTPETKDQWTKIHQKDEPDAHFHVAAKKPKHNPNMKEDANLHNQKDHYAAIEDVHVNLENRNHAFEEYGYGPLNPKEPSDDFWKQKAKVFNTTVEEAKKSRCGNCAAFNQSKEIMNRIADGLGPVGNVVTEKANLGFCEMFKFKCAAERTCDAWLVNGPINEEMNVGAVAGTGDVRLPPDQREPGVGVKQGKFAGKTTFMFKRKQFLEFQNLQKKDRKWWKSYLGKNEDYITSVRDYAKKNPKSPIIFEDEDTGHLFYARYGKE